jgi:LAO/AO transport system kinase
VQEKPTYNADYFIQGILQKDRIIFSKAITLIESTKPSDEVIAEAIIEACLQTQKTSKRIAITGSPGAGKSTFINAFGKLLLDNNNSIAVLAIDPSSSISKGSILGDKTRMEDLISHPNCYIRPTASSNTLGGVARKTRETIILCEAFGFDYILVETVGVGQSETLVKNMTDLFLLLLLPNAGDELQGIKRGIMEMADIILINKSEKENETLAKVAATQVKHALHLFSENEKGWLPQVLNISSLENIGLDKLQQTIDSYFLKTISNNSFSENRAAQHQFWFESSILEALQVAFAHYPTIQKEKQELLLKIKKQEISVQQAAKFLVQKHLKD